MRRGSGCRETTRRRPPCASGLRRSAAALVAALDDWAACATDRDQQAWVLAVVRQADPDPWRDRVRDPATWDDPAALRELADRAPVAGQSPQLLAVLGARLRARKLDAVGFLERVASAYPGDFWVNVEMGNALCDQSNWGEAIGYYRTALALRPETVSLRYAPRRPVSRPSTLGRGHRRVRAGRPPGPRERLAPQPPGVHPGLEGRPRGRGDRPVPGGDPPRPQHRLVALLPCHRPREQGPSRRGRRRIPGGRATAPRETLRVEAAPARAAAETGARRRRAGRLGAGSGGHPPEHDDWFGYAELCLFLGDEAEYRRARDDLLAQFGSATDPTVAERTGRACLLLPAAEDELRQAVALTERAVAAGRRAASLPTRIACSPRAWRGTARAGSTMPSS